MWRWVLPLVSNLPVPGGGGGGKGYSPIYVAHRYVAGIVFFKGTVGSSKGNQTENHQFRGGGVGTSYLEQCKWQGEDSKTLHGPLL